jgi:hypothetical protein
MPPEDELKPELVRLAEEIAAARTRLAGLREKLVSARAVIEDVRRRVRDSTPPGQLTQGEAKAG